MASPAVPPLDLIVVGAGAAGIACARAVHAAGLRVLLLEARDRCGGRAWSSDALGLGVELDHGATWVHSVCAGNPMLQLAKARGVELTPSCQGCSFVCDLSSGQVLDDKAMGPYYEAVEKADEAADEKANQAQEENAGQVSVLDALLEAGLPLDNKDASDSHHSGSKRKGQQKLKPHLMRWALAWEYEFDEGLPVEELSGTHQWTDGTEMPGGNHILEGGYGAFVRGLVDAPIAQGMAAVPSGSLEVRKGEVAARIDWNAEDGGEQGVLVTTLGGCEYFARRSVVTLPLGVLKSGDVTFHPPLEERRKLTIQRLGNAAYAKIFFSFPERFWKDAACGGWAVCGITPGQNESLFDRSWFFPVERAGSEGSTGVLCAVLAGDAARAVQAKSDEDVKAAAMSVLRQAVSCASSKKLFFKPSSSSVPEPTAMHVSRWLADPYAQGCWTEWVVGSEGAKDCSVLAEPLGEKYRLGFAGEHTTQDDGGTVHGAWLTGLREAENVLMACVEEGRFEGASAVAGAVRWMLYCREALARARALQEHNDCSSSESSSDSE